MVPLVTLKTSLQMFNQSRYLTKVVGLGLFLKYKEDQVQWCPTQKCWSQQFKRLIELKTNMNRTVLHKKELIQCKDFGSTSDKRW